MLGRFWAHSKEVANYLAMSLAISDLERWDPALAKRILLWLQRVSTPTEFEL